MIKVRIIGRAGWERSGRGIAEYSELVGNGRTYNAEDFGSGGSVYKVFIGGGKSLKVHHIDVMIVERFGIIKGWEGWKKRNGDILEPWYASRTGEEFRIDEKNYPGMVCFDNTGYAMPEDVEIVERDLQGNRV